MRELQGLMKAGIAAWAAAAACLHFYFAWAGFLEPVQQRSLHLLVFLPLVFLLCRARKTSPESRPSLVDAVLASLAFLPSLYLYLYANYLADRIQHVSPVSDLEFALGLLACALVLEAIRRAVTPILAVLVALSLLYLVVCEHMPGLWNYRDIEPRRIVEIMYLLIDHGIYGSLTGISASIVAIFLVFGAFVQNSGLGRLFHNVSVILAGRFAGGPAKVEVVSSGLFGMMSGSSVANVVTTGNITIPMMKRLGFPPHVAGGVEAASSVGGALMPPIMGAAAFVMAETIAIPYSEIITAAALPAFLYYFSILVAVHFDACRRGISGMPAAEIPSWRLVLIDLHFLLPLAALVYLLMSRYSAYLAAFWCTVAMIVVSQLRWGARMRVGDVFRAFVEAGKSIAVIAVAIAGAGMISAAFTVTGTFIAFSTIIQAAAAGSQIMLAILVMAFCLILGMGVPTTPAYIITAAIGAPLLAEFGTPILAIHLFIFYFAVLADATPPVAVASYAAAAIAGASPMRTGFVALRLAIGGFVCGFAFLWEPALLLRAPFHEIASTSLAVMLGLVAVNAALIGFFRAPLPAVARLVIMPLGLFACLVYALPDWMRIAAALLAIAIAWIATFRRSAADASPIGTR
jgi:TRAP transporter 4TM/12TM fusion protein